MGHQAAVEASSQTSHIRQVKSRARHFAMSLTATCTGQRDSLKSKLVSEANRMDGHNRLLAVVKETALLVFICVCARLKSQIILSHIVGYCIALLRSMPLIPALSVGPSAPFRLEAAFAAAKVTARNKAGCRSSKTIIHPETDRPAAGQKPVRTEHQQMTRLMMCMQMISAECGEGTQWLFTTAKFSGNGWPELMDALKWTGPVCAWGASGSDVAQVR